MTIWDNIYQNYQKGGEAWASLSKGIYPLFQEFLQASHFEEQCVLDIGCGTGKYLQFLQAVGFQTDGIDSSPTAIEMTKQVLADNAEISCVNMFEFEIPQNKYDLVISISTIHHGRKEQVEDLINRIYEALLPKGKVFITIPDFGCIGKWNTFKTHQKIAEGTVAPLLGPEKGLPHSFFKKEEVQHLFSKFKKVELNLDEAGRWFVQATK